MMTFRTQTPAHVGRRGQSTLEYILVISAILVAVIVAANTVIRTGTNQVMTDANNTMTNASKKLSEKLGLGSSTLDTSAIP